MHIHILCTLLIYQYLKTKNLTDSSFYFRPSVATDGIVFKIEKNELYVLLVKRALSETGETKEHRPFQNYWALPGGYIRSMENAEKALERELVEEAQFYLEKNNIIPHQIGFYSNPKRDEYKFDSKDNPSLHKQVMSVAYAAILN